MHAGYYGNSQNQTFNESSNSGQDYLAEVCRDWEAAAQQAKTQRVVIVRTGIVLAKEGGALAKMLPIFNIFAGGPLGNGQQWCSWVHRCPPPTPPPLLPLTKSIRNRAVQNPSQDAKPHSAFIIIKFV